jgi:hypothetical protein
MTEKYMKTRIGLAVCAALILCVCAQPVFAGEITGNGKWIAGSPDAPLNGNSECAYSGRQDNPTIDEGFRGVIAQSWGQFPKVVRDFLTSIGLHPGTACNPTRAGGVEP